MELQEMLMWRDDGGCGEAAGERCTVPHEAACYHCLTSCVKLCVGPAAILTSLAPAGTNQAFETHLARSCSFPRAVPKEKLS